MTDGLKRIRLWCWMLALLMLSGCGGSPGAPASGGSSGGTTAPPAAEAEKPEKDENFTPYDTPDFADAQFHEDLAEGGNGVRLDLSAVDQGYLGASVVADARLKLQVIREEITYNYDMASDGTPSIFPLQSGDGTYTVRVMKNVSESKYTELYTASCDVALADEFQPFLRPNDYVNYSQGSDCVKKAAQLAAQAGDEVGVVSAVYDYICTSVSYDADKAASVRNGYLSQPDATMASGKGICFDYAALAAAMLRSQGIPTKMIFGYVSPNDLYHAWNMFYTDQTGWVTVSYQVSKDSWNRLDLTFSANGADDTFVGDGSNYADLYVY